jgi:aryl-alcohol dehydrogenase-like predicted oxidoreductase
MPCRVLGRTGERVSAIGLGGWRLGLSHVDEALSVRIVREAIDRGITFLDNSWDYNDDLRTCKAGFETTADRRDMRYLTERALQGASP